MHVIKPEALRNHKTSAMAADTPFLTIHNCEKAFKKSSSHIVIQFTTRIFSVAVM